MKLMNYWKKMTLTRRCKTVLDDGSVLIGCIVDIFDREETIDIECEYFTINIGVGRIVSITKE